MRERRHHNNKGYRQIKRGKTAGQVFHMCRRLGLPFRNRASLQPASEQPTSLAGQEPGDTRDG